MGTLALVVGVAALAALGGYVLGRRQRPARRVFVAGFLCGSVAGRVVRRRLVSRVLRRFPPHGRGQRRWATVR